MNTSDFYKNNDEADKISRTVWVGNLHQRVSHRVLAELFYQIGPIEYVEFANDDHEKCEKSALVVFKYSISVEESIKLLCGTKLYGLSIIVNNYLKHFEDSVFQNQQNYFKQLVNTKHSNKLTNCNKTIRSDQGPYDKKYIPDSLPEPPMHNAYNNRNEDKYDRRSDVISRYSYKDKVSKYHHRNPYTKSENHRSEHNPNDATYRSRDHFRESGNHCSNSVEMYNRDHKHRDYRIHVSTNCKKNTSYYVDSLFVNEDSSDINLLPVRDPRDTMYRNSPLDQSKNNRYKNLGQHHGSDSYSQWPKSNNNYLNSDNSSSYTDHRKHNFTAERYNKSNTRQQNHYSDQEHGQNYLNEKYDDEYQNRYISYNQEKSRSRKYDHLQSNSLHKSYHPYNRNDGYERKELKNSYNERNRGSRDKHYNSRGTNQ